MDLFSELCVTVRSLCKFIDVFLLLLGHGVENEISFYVDRKI